MSRFLWGPFISDKIQNDDNNDNDDVLEYIENQNLNFLTNKDHFNLTYQSLHHYYQL